MSRVGNTGGTGEMVLVTRRAAGRGGVRRMTFERKAVTCLHCKRLKPHEGRGLCRTCYSQKSTRALYPLPEYDRVSQAKAARERQLALDSEGAGVWRKPLPVEPTAALPGSEEKIRVMGERLAQGLHLHHPGDATGMEDDSWRLELGGAGRLKRQF
jgi:hypothetical protein